MRLSALFASALAALGLVALATLIFDLSFQRAALLAPVIVLSAGAVVGLGVLWTKAALAGLRGQKPSDAPRTVADPDAMEDPHMRAR